MSFLSVLKSIGSVFGKVESVVVPLEPAIAAIPVYGPAFDGIFNMVVGVEGLFAGAAKAGAAKKATVIAAVNATAPAPVPETTLSTAIDQIVAALNQLQAAQAAVKT